MATDTQSLLEWLLDLMRDPHARAEFLDHPDRYLAEHGHGDVSAADLYDALCLAADDSRSHSDYRYHDDHTDHYPPPHHYDRHEDAGHYLKEYINNNYTYIDHHDTNIDNSIRQRIDTDGGDFDQNIHNDPVVASGDGSVAAGHDISDSTLTTGDRNVVGDDNKAVTGSDNTTAFGRGDATNANFDDAHFGSGSGVAVGRGDATGSADDNSTDTEVHGGRGDTSVNVAGSRGDADQDVDQSDSSRDDHSQSDSHDDSSSHSVRHVEASHDDGGVDVHL